MAYTFAMLLKRFSLFSRPLQKLWEFGFPSNKKNLNNDQRFACFRLRHVKKFLGIPDFDSPSSDLDGVIPVGGKLWK